MNDPNPYASPRADIDATAWGRPSGAFVFAMSVSFSIFTGLMFWKTWAAIGFIVIVVLPVLLNTWAGLPVRSSVSPTLWMIDIRSIGVGFLQLIPWGAICGAMTLPIWKREFCVETLDPTWGHGYEMITEYAPTFSMEHALGYYLSGVVVMVLFKCVKRRMFLPE